MHRGNSKHFKLQRKNSKQIKIQKGKVTVQVAQNLPTSLKKLQQIFFSN